MKRLKTFMDKGKNKTGHTMGPLVSVPLADDEMLITRQLFENVPLNQSVAVSIFSFDTKGNMRPTTNSVIVKII